MIAQLTGNKHNKHLERRGKCQEGLSNCSPPTFLLHSPVSCGAQTVDLAWLLDSGSRPDGVTEQRALGLQELSLGLVIVFGGNPAHSVSKWCVYLFKRAGRKPVSAQVFPGPVSTSPAGDLPISQLSNLRHRVNTKGQSENCHLQGTRLVISLDEASSQNPDGCFW